MAPIWLPLATAFIAALSALAGVILNSYLTRRDKALELSFRAAQESKNFLVARGEELYLQIDEMDNYVAANCRLIHNFCNGHVTFDDFRRIRRDSWEDRQKFSLSRIKLSVRSFFPELQPLHDELAENLLHLSTIDRVLMDAREHKPKLLYRVSADTVRLQKLVMNTGEQLREALSMHLAETFRSKTHF